MYGLPLHSLWFVNHLSNAEISLDREAQRGDVFNLLATFREFAWTWMTSQLRGCPFSNLLPDGFVFSFGVYWSSKHALQHVH